MHYVGFMLQTFYFPSCTSATCFPLSVAPVGASVDSCITHKAYAGAIIDTDTNLHQNDLFLEK